MATQLISSKTKTLVPVMRELPGDLDTPISVYLKMRGLGPSFLLESVEGGEHLARYSMIGTQPKAVIRSWRDRVVLEEEGRWSEVPLEGRDVLDLLRDMLPTYDGPIDAAFPRFTGGAVGYLGYDIVRSFEKLPTNAVETLGLPETTFLICERIVIYDHVKHRLLVIAHYDPDVPNGEREAEAALDEMVARLRRRVPDMPEHGKSDTAGSEMIQTTDRAAYEEAVRKAKEHIAVGDIFQVVVSRRMHRRTSAEPLDIYRALRRVNPSPYMFYLELPDGVRLIGSSPEVLVRVDNGIAETRPLAGTRPRGATTEDDIRLEEELLADEKERAEHVMLVDLSRNDLGRVCRYGTVHTPVMLDVERYSHVMHIVSDVQGEVRDDKDSFDVLRACFPAGTVSGAPKVRAMEIIDELEPERRGPYAGAVGYLGFSGNMDTCITLRTMVMQGDRVYFQAGAGIVADSNPASEYDETGNKLGALARALDMAESGI